MLSDRASIAETIEFESELKAIKIVEKEKRDIVSNLLILDSLTDDQIAKAAKVSKQFVEKVKNEIR